MIKISVITAVYNSRDTVNAALDSVLHQSHPSVEMVIVDGQSSDGTVDLIERYRSRGATLVSERDNGIYDALNKGIALSTGDVVGFLHADDLFASPTALAWIAKAFEDPSVEAVYGDLVYVRRDRTESIVRQWRAGPWTPAALRWGWMPPHPTFYVRRSVYQRLGAFDTSLRIAADYDCMLRMLHVHRIKTAYVPRTIVAMRVGGISNRSLSSIVRKSREDLLVVRRHGVGSAGSILLKNLRKVSQFWRREP